MCSPEGTAETLPAPSAVPPGLFALWGLVPNVETLGYYRISLRDKGLALPTLTRSQSEPSFPPGETS